MWMSSNVATATVAQLPIEEDVWTDVVTEPQESAEAYQERCEKVRKKARRKELWASFLLSLVSGIGNTSIATQKSKVTLTDDHGNKTKGTITTVDTYKRDNLNERDREINNKATANYYAGYVQNAGCQ